MTCHEIRPFLSPSLDDALDTVQQARMRAHLAACSACAARHDRLRASRDAFRLVAPQRRRRRGRRSGRGASGRPHLATVALVTACAVMLLFTEARRPEAARHVHGELASMDFLPSAPGEFQPACYDAADCGVARDPSLR